MQNRPYQPSNPQPFRHPQYPGQPSNPPSMPNVQQPWPPSTSHPLPQFFGRPFNPSGLPNTHYQELPPLALPPQYPQTPLPPFDQFPKRPRPLGAIFLGASRHPIWSLILIFVLLIASYGAGVISHRDILPSTSSQPQILVTTRPVANVTSPAISTSTPTRAPTPTPTLKPTQPPKWTTTQSFKGSGSKKTAIFTVSNDWKILWTCNPSSSYNGQYNVIVNVYNADGSVMDNAINTICKAGNTSDNTEEHQAGNVYLDIESESDWTVQVQQLR